MHTTQEKEKGVTPQNGIRNPYHTKRLDLRAIISINTTQVIDWALHIINIEPILIGKNKRRALPELEGPTNQLMPPSKIKSQS